MSKCDCACDCKCRRRILILGAAGRDFHNFNCFYRENETYEVVGFTATQIPGIDHRPYPKELSGKLYPEGLPIMPEDDLEKIVKEKKVDECILAYSDLNHKTVMQIASRVMATGCDFKIMGPKATMIKPVKPLIGICAVRTGCGKSQTSRYVTKALRAAGLSVGVIRHPMPYGDLAKQAVQRFETFDDLVKGEVTFEEREEYEFHINNGTVVYVGVDFEPILRLCEKENDVTIWDGGNNDWSFYETDFLMTIADPHRPGHEYEYFPGAVNFRMADAIIINKVNTAPEGGVEKIKESCKKFNPKAKVIPMDSLVSTEHPELIKGKKVLLVEDGPTLTHGEMTYGAAKVAADQYGAAEIVDPRPGLVGTLAETFKKYPHVGKLLPCMGYFPQQVKDMQDSVNNVECDVVISGTPLDLTALIKIEKPVCVVKYDSFDIKGELSLKEEIQPFIEFAKKKLNK